jgi:drug/metabolite transporter (DMT)-like permease
MEDDLAPPAVMSRARLFVAVLLAMLAFAANPLLCRLALKDTGIDPGSFTLIRLCAGAVTLGILLQARRPARSPSGSWGGALSLFLYAITLSYAYVSLEAGTGTLLLFGAVQATMISAGIFQGERLGRRQVAGLAAALLGLVILLAPGATAPTWHGAVLMILSGVAWGVYSLLGRRGEDAVATTTGNFLGASALAVAAAVLAARSLAWDLQGAVYAVASGAIASGIGYAIWYAALPGLRATHAAVVQLSVPAITAFGGVLLLGESLTIRLISSSLAILGGIALVVYRER